MCSCMNIGTYTHTHISQNKATYLEVTTMDNKTKTLERLITQKPEEYKEESTERPEDIKIVWGTSGEYPDGTKWERDATPEEEEKYSSWAE